MQRAVASVALAFLLVTSGCNGVFQERTPPVTRDNFDVPEDPATTTNATGTATDAGSDGVESDVAPGLASSGIRDAFEMAAAHRSRLAGASFQSRRRYVVRAENGSVLWRNSVTVRVAANRTRFAVVVDGDRFRDSDDVHRFWSAGNDSPVVHERIDDGRSTYERSGQENDGDLAVREVLLDDPTYHTRLYRLLSTVRSASVAPDAQPSPQRYIVRAREFTDTYLIRGFGRADVTNVSMTAIVGDDGLVRRLFVSYETTIDGRPVRVLETFSFSGVGETRVDPPGWLDDAPDREDDADEAE